MTLPRQRRRRLPEGWANGLQDLPDLHDYYQPPLRRRGHRPPSDAPPIVVTDDWPDQVPITDEELRVIEGHLAKELDELFGPLP